MHQGQRAPPGVLGLLTLGYQERRQHTHSARMAHLHALGQASRLRLPSDGQKANATVQRALGPARTHPTPRRRRTPLPFRRRCRNPQDLGSYHTPDSLVQALLGSALAPVLDRVEAEAHDPAESLLGLAVIDPACGSSHFLLAAARRIATRVVSARADGVASMRTKRLCVEASGSKPSYGGGGGKGNPRPLVHGPIDPSRQGWPTARV